MIGFAIDLAKWPIAAGGAIVDRRSSLGWTVGASTVIATTAAATAATVAPSVATKVSFIGRNSWKFSKFPFYPQGPIKFDIG